MSTDEVPHRTEEPRSIWYDRIINLLASILLVLLWRVGAWAATFLPGNVSSAETYFLWIIAFNVAMNAPMRRRK